MKKQRLLFFIAIISSFKMYGQLEGTNAGDTLKQAYFELSSESLYAKAFLLMGDCTSGINEVGGQDFNDYRTMQEFMRFNVQSNNIELKNLWYRCYDIVYLCNRTIDLIPDEAFDNVTKERYIAEAKFIRSLMFFELSKVFDSIPVLTSVYYWPRIGYRTDYVDGNILPKVINPLSGVYTQIEQDLIAAIDHLPLRSELDESSVYRVTKGAAQALLAKVYLYESSYAKNYPSDTRFSGLTQKWDDALQMAENVMNSSEYDLVGSKSEKFITWWDSSYIFHDSTPGFRYIFTKEGNDCKESVFAVRDLMPGTGWMQYGKNVITQYTTCRWYFNKILISSMKGWGFMIPSPRLINEFTKETGNPKDDPRYTTTVGTSTDSIYTRDAGGLGWYLMDNSHSATGNYCRKYEASPTEFWDFSQYVEGPNNIPIIRLSDVALMASEAAFEKGKDSLALKYLNLVRTRARNCGTTGYPADLDTIAFKDIVHERQVELACEGHSFFDLVRWNLAYDSINEKYNYTFDESVKFIKGQNEFFPTPDNVFEKPVDIIANSQNSLFKIYPNPVTDILTIETNSENASISILDLQGRKIQTTDFHNTTNIDLRNIPKGIYLISVETNNETAIQKLIKK